jgi:hypothetical protein
MRRLVQAKCNVNASDRYGQSALSLAAESSSSSQEAAISLLLDTGADTTQKGYEGKTPAEWAEETGNPVLAAHIRRAPTLRGRWMAAEQRLAMAKLLQRRLGRRSPLYPLVNRDVMEVVARWMPYTRRRDLVSESAAAGSNSGPDARAELDPFFAHGSAQIGLRQRRQRQQTNVNAQGLQLGHPGSNGGVPQVEVDDRTTTLDATSPTDVRTVEQGDDSDSGEDYSSEVLDRYLECVDTLIERHGHQPRRYDSITVQVEPRRDRARAMHLDPNGSGNGWPIPSGVEWTQRSICCAHCALRSDSTAKAGLDQAALQQHVLHEHAYSYTDYVVMISPAAETGLSTVQAPNHDFDHGGDARARVQADVEPTELSQYSPRSPRRLPPRLEYESMVACAPARSCVSLLFSAVGRLGTLIRASTAAKLCCEYM